MCVLNLGILYDCFRVLNSETGTAVCVYSVKESDMCAVIAASLY